MKPYQRSTKFYSLWVNDKKIGEYTTVDGAKAAAKRKGLKDYEIKQLG